jgi:queuine tRNA-ribosyltransferase
MGLGDPIGIIEAVALGVDMMDCVLPTRLGRHGTLLTDSGRLNIKRAEFARSTEPIDNNCPCEVCQRHSRAYLRHLANVSEPTAATLCSLHNLAWLLGFMDRIRHAISKGTLADLRAETHEVWSR